MSIQQECCNCGVVFWITDTVYNNRRKDKQRFYCPNGHGQSYTESEADKLRRELANQKQQNARLEEEAAAANRAAAAAIAARKRTEKRIHGGTCPCCKRHFASVERHMKNKHPDIVALPKRVLL